MKDLAGKTAVVTGAALGIGLGIATALSQVGVKSLSQPSDMFRPKPSGPMAPWPVGPGFRRLDERRCGC